MALKWLRDQMKYLHWILWLIVAAFIFALFFDFGSINQLGRSDTDVAATVGSEQITFAEFRTTYQRVEGRYRDAFGDQWSDETAQQLGIARQALDQLVNRRIMLLEAERVGLRVSDAEVQKAIFEFPAFQDADGKFAGRERVQMLLRNNRLGEEEFVESLREDLLIDKLTVLLASTTYVSDAEIEQSWRDQNEKAQIEYVKLPAAEMADVTAGEDEIAGYYESNKSDYQLPEQRVADLLLVDRGKLREQVEIADEELRAYYDQNIADFTQEEQVRARHILLRIGPDRDLSAANALAEDLKRRALGGEDFGALAREFSDDTSNAERGGDLGFFGRGAMVPEFEQEAFGAETGEIAGPVQTDFGVHLIEVQAKTPGGARPFEQVKAIVQARMINERIDELAETKATDLGSKLTQASTTADLEALAAEDPILEFKTTAPFGQTDSVEGIGRSPDFSAAVFGGKVGDITEAVKVPRGWLVARIAEVQEPRIPELEDVRDQVVEAANREVRKLAAAERLAEAKERIASGEADLATVAADLGLQVTESSEFGRFGSIQGLGQAKGIVSAALSLDEGALSEVQQVDDGAVLFRVTSRTGFDADAFADAKDDTRQSLIDERVQRLTTSLVEQRRRDLQPTYDPRVIEDFGIDPQAS